MCLRICKVIKNKHFSIISEKLMVIALSLIKVISELNMNKMNFSEELVEIDMEESDEEIEKESFKKFYSIEMLIFITFIIAQLILYFIRKETFCMIPSDINDFSVSYSVNISEAQDSFRAAVLEMSPAVSDFSKTPNGQHYIKLTESQVFYFPPGQTQKLNTSKQLIEYRQLSTESERVSLLRQMRFCYHKGSKKRDKSKIKWGWNLFNNPFSTRLHEVEFYYYDKEYQIGNYSEEERFCVVGTGRNLFSRGAYKEFFLTLSWQNYTNFHVVIIDDNSNDSSTEGMYGFVEKNTPNLKSRIKFVRNKQNIGAFANKDSGIKEHCLSNEIVMDIDADDSLAGRQVFQLINAAYHSKPDVWITHTSHFKYSTRGVEGKMTTHQVRVPSTQYRDKRREWSTSHLKTYRMSLYEKIPIDYLTQMHEDPSTGLTTRKYQRYSSDQVMMISMVELAGNERIVFIPEAVYAYKQNLQIEQDSRCHRLHQFYDEMKTRSKFPLKKLETLNSPVQIDVNHEHLQIFQVNFDKYSTQYIEQCVKAKK